LPSEVNVQAVHFVHLWDILRKAQFDEIAFLKTSWQLN
jgi:hypothetical protein